MSETLTSLLIDPNEPLIHRDLSWLQFNDRVLSEAEDADNPLLERLKFLGITASNLDEFFMIRFASLNQELELAVKREDSERALRLGKVKQQILTDIASFGRRQSRCFDKLRSALRSQQIEFVSYERMLKRHRKLAREIFEDKVVETLPAREERGIAAVREMENLGLSLLFPDSSTLALPGSISTLLWRHDTKKRLLVFQLGDLLRAFGSEYFGLEGEPLLLRLTRDGDVPVILENEDIDSIPETVRKTILGRQTRMPVRLQVYGNYSSEGVEPLRQDLSLQENQVFHTTSMLPLRALFSFVNSISSLLPKTSSLTYEPLKARIPRRLRDTATVFEGIEQHDYLLHHPYDSFDSYINFLAAAADDPKVESIQQTVYRVDSESKITEILKRAASTKSVRVLIEPRARFDEINNIRLAEELSAAGVKVVFSTGKLKLHAKITHVLRDEGGYKRAYTHLSTGNYNAKTARVYTDMSILTAHPGLGKDASRFFDQACQQKIPLGLDHMILAPNGLHKRIRALIRAEIRAARKGRPAKIFAKVNALVDSKIVRELYKASEAGVQIDLLVRGACSLIPGLPGLSENIRVYSIVDRLLEHSRMYYFSDSETLFLSSADWMPRNFFSRLEIAFPVYDERIFSFLTDVAIPAYLADRAKARRLTRRGTWRRRPSAAEEETMRAQAYFEQLALRRYRSTPLA